VASESARELLGWKFHPLIDLARQNFDSCRLEFERITADAERLALEHIAERLLANPKRYNQATADYMQALRRLSNELRHRE